MTGAQVERAAPLDLLELLDLWREDASLWSPSLSCCRTAPETPRQWGIGLGPISLSADLTDEAVYRALASRLESPSHVIVRLRGRGGRQVQVSCAELADPGMWRSMRGESAPVAPSAPGSSLAPAPTDIVTLMLSQMMQERREMQAEMRELQRRIVDRPPPPPPPDPIATIVQAVEGMRAVGKALPGVTPGVVVDDEGGGSLLSMIAPLAPSIDRLVSSIARSIDVSTDTAAEERRERARIDAERARIDAEAEAESRLIASAAQAGLSSFVRDDVDEDKNEAPQ